jgi:hypothetical protein
VIVLPKTVEELAEEKKSNLEMWLHLAKKSI